MYEIGKYKQKDSMSDLISQNYPILLVINRFGFTYGFADKTIGEVCAENNVDTLTFLAIVNLLIDEDEININQMEYNYLSIPCLIYYLRNSHNYFLEFKLPAIRKQLIDAIDVAENKVGLLIIKYYDQYVAEVRKHMVYEEKKVFPYIENLLKGQNSLNYNINTYSKQHDKVEAKLSELKDIIIRYYSSKSTNLLSAVLFDIFGCAKDLASHNYIEDFLLVPAIRMLEVKK